MNQSNVTTEFRPAAHDERSQPVLVGSFRSTEPCGTPFSWTGTELRDISSQLSSARGQYPALSFASRMGNRFPE
jgi:hypothetical protein